MVEWATHMRMYAGSSPTSIDHREEFIYIGFVMFSKRCKINECKKKKKDWVNGLQCQWHNILFSRPRGHGFEFQADQTQGNIVGL